MTGQNQPPGSPPAFLCYSHPMLRRLALCLTLLPHLASAAGTRQAPPAPQQPPAPQALCESAITEAESRQTLPARVLQAIALRESGRVDPATGRVRPWPWTINYPGMGRFYDTREQAIAAVRDIQASGGQSIDVGCMQVNLMHHPNAFASLEDAFNPMANAAYAGRFLRTLYAGSGGDWGAAIAAYHSKTPGVSDLYRDQVLAAWNTVDPSVLAHLGAGSMGYAQPFPMVVYPSAAPPLVEAWRTVSLGPAVPSRAYGRYGGAYRSFQPASAVYGDFAHGTAVHGTPARRTGRNEAHRTPPIDLRVRTGLPLVYGGLVEPQGVAAPKPAPIAAAKRKTPTVNRPTPAHVDTRTARETG